MEITKHDIFKLQGKIRDIAKTRQVKQERWVLEWYLADRLDPVVRYLDGRSGMAEEVLNILWEVTRIERVLCLLGIIPTEFETEDFDPLVTALGEQTRNKRQKELEAEQKRKEAWS